MRHVILALACVLALAVFAAGLIAPLTPSEGMPPTRALVGFCGAPLLLLAVCFAFAQDRGWRIALALEAGFILAFTAWLLTLQAGTFMEAV